MEKNKYLIFIDVDGTLVEPFGKKVPESTKQTINNLRNKGHIFVVLTGRSLDKIQDIENIDCFDYQSALFGSIIYSTKLNKIVNTPKHMKAEDVLPLVELFENRNWIWTYKSNVGECCIARKRIGTRECIKITRKKFLEDLENGNVLQMLFYGYFSEDEKQSFSAFSFYDIPDGYSDATIKGVSKACAVEYFKNLFPGYTTVSIGDSANDTEMFESTEISIAMGNALNEIKKKTTFETKSVAEDGVSYALQNILKL